MAPPGDAGVPPGFSKAECGRPPINSQPHACGNGGQICGHGLIQPAGSDHDPTPRGIVKLLGTLVDRLQKVRYDGGRGLWILFHRVMTQAVEDLEAAALDIAFEMDGIRYRHPVILATP